jgi:hypothetical protein
MPSKSAVNTNVKRAAAYSTTTVSHRSGTG